MDIDTNLTLERLKNAQSAKVQLSLDKLNSIIEEYVNKGGKDFSISTIGKKVSEVKGGPTYETIRATKNKHYRDLIEIWAAKAGTSTKKPKSVLSSTKRNNSDYALLERLTDPALRGAFGSIITERDRFRNEVNLLKKSTDLIIDRRPKAKDYTNNIVHSITNIINEREYDALKYSVSDECINEHNWEKLQNGRIIDIEYNMDIFPRGYVDAIIKIISAYDREKNI
jgi:hypothetical protein